MSGLKLWPIVVGVLIDIGGSLGAGIVYVGAVAAVQLARGVAIDEGTLTLDLPELVVTSLVGLLFTATGGFVAAQMAKARYVQYGIAVGAGSICVALLGELAVGSDDTPAWFNVLSYLTVIPAGALGGYLASRATSSPAAES